MQGHIKLGAPGALRDYLLVDPRQYAAMAANPMAARVSSGGKYGEVEAWSTWVQEDWQMGVGQRDPEAGGLLYGEVDSRVPRQLLLPQASQFIPPDYGATTRGLVGHFPQYGTTFTTLTIGAGQAYTKIAIRTKSPQAAKTAAAEWFGFSVFASAQAAGGTYGLAEIRSESGSLPGGTSSAFDIVDIDLANILGQYPQWLQAMTVSSASKSHDTNYWQTIGDGDGVTLTLYGSTTAGSSTGMAVAAYNGSSWVAITNFYPFFLSAWWYTTTPTTSMQPAAFVRGNSSKLYYIAQTLNASTATSTKVFELNSTTWTLKDTETGAMNSKHVALFDGNIYFALGAKLAYFPVGGSAVTTTATDAHGFETWNGYLWRYYNNNVYYSADGSTWTGPIEIGSTDYAVRSMCGMDQQMYVATDEALWMIAPGDIPVGIMRWGSISNENGADMVNHQNALYIAVGGRVVRFTPDGTSQDVFINRDDDLPASRLGKVEALLSMNAMVVALVAPNSSMAEYTTAKSLWAYNGQGWHFVGAMPVPMLLTGYSIPIRTPSNGLYYDFANTKALWCAPSAEQAFFFPVSDYALNPYNDSATMYMPAGWMQTDRFYGGQVELEKDWESVRVWGEFDTGASVKVYWQDEGSTGWELLGTVDEDGEELRWSDYSTRPAGRWIKLGLLLLTTSRAVSPKVTAVGVKFLPMVTDRERWQLAILVSPDQEMLDGERNTYTVAQQLAHLRSMVQRVPPCIYEDVDGTQYEVKVLNASRNMLRYDVVLDGQVRMQHVYQMTVEQVTDGTYSA